MGGRNHRTGSPPGATLPQISRRTDRRAELGWVGSCRDSWFFL